MKKFLVYTLVFLSGVVSYGQSTIFGRILNEEKKPLEFATIGIKKDSLIFKTIVTDSSGNFKISNIPKGNYKLLFNYIGYKTIGLEVDITKDTTIKMVLDSKIKELSEVVVSGNYGVLERKADRFVYSVINSEITKGSTIYEVLKQAPLINVNDNTNAIGLVNKSQTVIYINGIKSSLSQDAIVNLLKNTNAENLSRIEMITVPSSNYNVQGNTGIINIVMKKNNLDGINGSVRVSDDQAANNSQSTGANINYRKNKLGINANVFASNTKQEDVFDLNFLFKQNNFSQSDYTNYIIPEIMFGGSCGVDYDINTKQTIGLRMDYVSSNQANENSLTLTRFKPTAYSTNDSLQKTQNIINNSSSELDLNANYHYTIDSTGKFLNIDVDYLSYINNKSNYSETDLLNRNYEPISQTQKFKQLTPQDIENISSKIEYNHVFNATNTLNIGADGSSTNTDNDTYFGNFVNKDYQKDSSQSFHYKYTEDIYSLFATYNRTWNTKWQTSTGLRLENTKNNGDVTTTGQSFSNNYWNLLPYFALSYSPSEKNQFAYTLSNRLSRPAFWELNPFRYYTTPNVYVENNPFLQPQQLYINELSYTFNTKYTFLLNYTHTNNAYQQIQLAENDIVKLVRLNYGTNDDVSASISTQQYFFNKFIQSNISISGGVTKYKGDAEYLIIDQTAPYFQASINNTLHISTAKKWFGFLNASYNSPTKLSNGYLRSINDISIGIKKIYNNWTVALWLYDVLKGEQLRITLEDDKILNTGVVYNDTRNIRISVSYKFGNQKLKINRERETSNTEIKNRTQR